MTLKDIPVTTEASCPKKQEGYQEDLYDSYYINDYMYDGGDVFAGYDGYNYDYEERRRQKNAYSQLGISVADEQEFETWTVEYSRTGCPEVYDSTGSQVSPSEKEAYFEWYNLKNESKHNTYQLWELDYDESGNPVVYDDNGSPVTNDSKLDEYYLWLHNISSIDEEDFYNHTGFSDSNISQNLFANPQQESSLKNDLFGNSYQTSALGNTYSEEVTFNILDNLDEMVDLANQAGWEEDGPETLNQDLARCIVYGYKDAAKGFQGIDTEERIKSLIKCLKDELKRNFK